MMRWQSLIIVLCIIFFPLNTFAASKIEKLKKAAEAGDPNDQFILGQAYDWGEGIKPNYKEAAKWYAKAAEQGLGEAQNALGSLYQSGDGVSQDYKKSVELYEKAAAQGNDAAISNLGYMYDLGLGVEEDNAKAVELYEKAADNGYIQAMVNLGMMYLQGQGVERDDVEGYKWYELARFYTTTARDQKLKWSIRDVLGSLKAEMTKEQIKEGQQRASEWSQTHQIQNSGISQYAPANQD